MFSFALPLNLSPLPQNWFGKSSVGDVRVGAQPKFLLGFFDFHALIFGVSCSFNPLVASSNLAPPTNNIKGLA
jgi:hypothetical protein